MKIIRLSLKKIIVIMVFCLLSISVFGQEKNFIDHPYIALTVSADSLVVPDKIYMSILISEEDTKGKIAVEKLEKKMNIKLESLGIDIEKQLSLQDLGSNFKRYFLKGKDVQKSKTYRLWVDGAMTAGKVIKGLEQIEISNISLEKTEFSKIEALSLTLKEKAIMKAKQHATAMLSQLGQKVGKAIYISDTQTGIVNPQRVRAVNMVMYRASEMKESAPPALVFEKMKVKSTVTVYFSID